MLLFFGCWIYCVATSGFLIGVSIGWLPSAIVAVVGYLIIRYGWPLLIIVIAFAVWLFRNG